MGNSNAYLGPETRQSLRILSDFTRKLPIDMRPRVILNISKLPIEGWLLGNGKTSLLYLHNPVDHQQATRECPMVLWTGAGKHRVKWMDPATGKPVSEETVQTNGANTMIITSPSFKEDLAAKIDRVA